ncbi:MAG: SMC-Scp complex subunit ScpB [Clostridia bacterium]|nr:SMC-Scp complex subunit ScpB [Clostridia bacterium]MBR5742703.1 SMC-Scp complex subunit ScpB [Clostridia bacterium]
MTRLRATIEAILFAAGDPVHILKLAEVLGEEKKTVEGILAAMALAYEEDELRGVKLLILEDKAQLVSKPAFGEKVLQVLEQRRSPSLSPSALEVLSIVAYRQPVTRGVIEQIRGVDSAYTLTNLLEKGILEECGRLDVPGRPILYRTSEAFLRIFGLSSLKDLPPLPDEMGDAQIPLFSDAEEEPIEP